MHAIGMRRYDAHFSEWSNAVEMAAVLGDRSLFLDKLVLDLACGTGRMTVGLFGIAAAILAADFSEQSLHNLASKAASHQDVQLGLAWCDVTQLLLSPRLFDAAVCAQLLEHISLPEQRAFLQHVCSGLKPSGSLVLTAYHYNFFKRLLRSPVRAAMKTGFSSTASPWLKSNGNYRHSSLSRE